MRSTSPFFTKRCTTFVLSRWTTARNPRNYRAWDGDSRGHWEGDTLVVETTNFSDKTNYRGSGSNLHLVERFKRVDTDAIGYELTVDDPTTWVRSWTAAFPMRPSEGPIYEYACHEANMSLMNMLEVARDEEKTSQSRK